MSDGEWVTLGAREVDDLAVAVAHLRTLEHVSTIGLWGRSMGAVTALLYAQKDPSIAGVVRVAARRSDAWMFHKPISHDERTSLRLTP